MNSSSESGAPPLKHHAKHSKHSKSRRSLGCALAAGSVIETALASVYCFVVFVIFWQVLDDPVNFPGLFPMRIDTAMLMLTLICLYYAIVRLAYLQKHYDRFFRSVVFLREKGAKVDLKNLLAGGTLGYAGGAASEHAAITDLDCSAAILRRSHEDYVLRAAIWVLAAVLPWNLWGYTRETLFGGLVLFVPIIWILFALNAYTRLYSMPSTYNNPVWYALRELA